MKKVTAIILTGILTLGVLTGCQSNSKAEEKGSSEDAKTIKVAASAAPETGNLNSDKNALAFANSFGTKNVTADTEGTELTGEIRVTAANVKAAAAGNYTGTTTFAISYAANK